MAITRYDGPVEIFIELEENDSAKIVHGSGTNIELYHSNDEHEEEITSSASSNTVGDAADWTHEIAGSLKVQIVDFNGDPFSNNGQFPGGFLSEGDGPTNYTHTQGTNVIGLGSSIVAISAGSSYNIIVTWVSHDAASSFTLNATHTDILNIGLNNGDHVDVKSGEHITIEQGPDYRPGLK